MTEIGGKDQTAAPKWLSEAADIIS